MCSLSDRRALIPRRFHREIANPSLRHQKVESIRADHCDPFSSPTVRCRNDALPYQRDIHFRTRDTPANLDSDYACR